MSLCLFSTDPLQLIYCLQPSIISAIVKATNDAHFFFFLSEYLILGPRHCWTFCTFNISSILSEYFLFTWFSGHYILLQLERKMSKFEKIILFFSIPDWNTYKIILLGPYRKT